MSRCGIGSCPERFCRIFPLLETDPAFLRTGPIRCGSSTTFPLGGRFGLVLGQVDQHWRRHGHIGTVRRAVRHALHLSPEFLDQLLGLDQLAAQYLVGTDLRLAPCCRRRICGSARWRGVLPTSWPWRGRNGFAIRLAFPSRHSIERRKTLDVSLLGQSDLTKTPRYRKLRVDDSAGQGISECSELRQLDLFQ